MTALISISLNVVSIAVVCVASNSRCAMVRRRRDMRVRSSRRPSVEAGGEEGTAAWRGFSAGASFSATWAVSCLCRYISTSALVTRPSAPVPLILLRSRFLSRASRAATGLTWGAASRSLCCPSFRSAGVSFCATGSACFTSTASGSVFCSSAFCSSAFSSAAF